jgi:hypothetical protein
LIERERDDKKGKVAGSAPTALGEKRERERESEGSFIIQTFAF